MRVGKRGQSLVEFALTLPLLLLLLFGIIDFSYYIYGWSTIQFAAGRGAQQASTQPPAMLQNTYTSGEVGSDDCLGMIYDRTKGGTWGFTPEDSDFSFKWFKVEGLSTKNMLENSSSVSRNEIIVPNTIVQLEITFTAQPLTPLAQTIFQGKDWEFRARARRTILNIDIGANNICTK